MENGNSLTLKADSANIDLALKSTAIDSTRFLYRANQKINNSYDFSVTNPTIFREDEFGTIWNERYNSNYRFVIKGQLKKLIVYKNKAVFKIHNDISYYEEEEGLLRVKDKGDSLLMWVAYTTTHRRSLGISGMPSSKYQGQLSYFLNKGKTRLNGSLAEK